MKLLILANNDVGLYQFRKELIAELLKAHQVMISLPNGDLVRPLEAQGCNFIETPVDRRGINPLNDLKLLFCYLQILLSYKPELVLTYTIKPNIYGGFACRLLKIPYAVNITGLGTAFQKKGLLRAVIIAMYRIALRKAKVVFFENVENQQSLLQADIVHEEQCCLLNGAGVNLEHYTYTDYPTTSPVRFLFMGRIMKEKGVDELFAAMRKLRQDGLDCVLDVLGNYEEDYADLICQYESEGWLFYHGYQRDVRPFIANSHCFVLPSWHEGMANTNLECAAMGRPVITSRIHGCLEAVVEGKSGYLCEPKDAESLYRVMKHFLVLDYEHRAQMGYVGREHIEAVFDKQRVIEETIRALQR